MRKGDRVTWSYSASGEGRKAIAIAAIVLKVTDKRVTIEFARLVRGEWVKEKKVVAPEKLTPRSKPAAELGETA